MGEALILSTLRLLRHRSVWPSHTADSAIPLDNSEQNTVDPYRELSHCDAFAVCTSVSHVRPDKADYTTGGKVHFKRL